MKLEKRHTNFFIKILDKYRKKKCDIKINKILHSCLIIFEVTLNDYESTEFTINQFI